MRALDEQEAQAVWAGIYASVNYEAYERDVKSMRPNVTYELTPDTNVSASSTRRRYAYAAKTVGKQLLWAPAKKVSGRLVCKLADVTPERRNGISREPALATPQRSGGF